MILLLKRMEYSNSRICLKPNLLVRLLLCAFSLNLMACVSPSGYLEKEETAYDLDTSYHVEDHSDGFTLTIYYSHYQFWPNYDSVDRSGKAILRRIAKEIATEREKKLKPIAEESMETSLGRNGFSGLTSLTGEVRVYYK